MSEELKAEEFDEGTEEFDEEEQERMRRRRERIRRMKQEKERRLRLQRICKFAVPVAAVVLAFGIGALVHVVSAKGAAQPEQQERGENIGEEEQETQPSGQLSGQISEGDAGAEAQIVHIKDIAGQNGQVGSAASGNEAGQNDQTGEDNAVAAVASAKVYAAHTTAQTAAPPDEVNSKYAVFIDLESGDILAQRDYLTVITPASMTKVLTVLVAAEQVKDLDDTFTVTIDITDYSYSNGCSSVGFEVGETVTVRDLFYGTILPSGGDAAVALATYVAGSHEAFVEMMNEKAEELGLSDTAHFTNCVGLYDENHHCTVYDMAMIMEAALDNELCREVLNARIYTTSATKAHPEGITISNWFLRKIEDKDTGGEIVCAKTGYVMQSDSCAVSYGVDKSGRGYVCATAGAHSSWRCIYDHVALYKKYAQE
ncbi:MAG: serine hydrolase [Acetatifactor sp.]|nr:serine hydrolase [Acetatifactor sp.]